MDSLIRLETTAVHQMALDAIKRYDKLFQREQDACWERDLKEHNEGLSSIWLRPLFSPKSRTMAEYKAYSYHTPFSHLLAHLDDDRDRAQTLLAATRHRKHLDQMFLTTKDLLILEYGKKKCPSTEAGALARISPEDGSTSATATLPPT